MRASNKTKTIELWISNHLVCAMVNADESGLDADDIKAIDDAIETYGPVFHVITPDTTETDFRSCDLTGLASDCYLTSVVISDD